MTQTLAHNYNPRGVARAVFADRSPELVLSGPAGTGKAQPLDAMVWTPTGPRRMGELAIGDLVLTPTGGAAPITAIPFRGMAPTYRVTFSDGTQVDCSDGHLWQVAWRDSSEREHEQVLSLAAIMAVGLRERSGTRPRFWIPRASIDPDQGRRWIESVEYLGEQECQCITVGTDEGLYLTEGFVVTHNSRACLEKVHLTCLATPGVRALAVRKTLVSLTSTGLVTFREHVAAESLAVGDVAWFGGSRQEPASYRYSNGSRLVVGGMDDPTKIMSSEYDLVYVQEAIELNEDEWEKITTRLRNHKISFQQLLADCNPDAPTHWLLQRTYKGLTKMLESRHEDNPTLFNDDGTMTVDGADYMGKLDRLTGVRKYRLRDGKWVAAEGVIYDEFDPAVHLVDLADVIPGGREKVAKGKKLTVRDIPEEWPRFWAVDFGFVNPFVLQCWTEDPDGQLIMYREIYRTRQTVDQHAADIMAVVSEPDPNHTPGPKDRAATGRRWLEPKPRAIICDHDAEGRATLALELNLPTRAAHKKVKEGIETVQRRLRPRADGRPGMVFLRDAVVSRDQFLVDAKKPAGTIEEFPSYVWDIRDGGKTKDEPVKLDDHGMDTTRYMAVYRDPKSRPGIRTL